MEETHRVAVEKGTRMFAVAEAVRTHAFLDLLVTEQLDQLDSSAERLLDERSVD